MGERGVTDLAARRLALEEAPTRSFRRRKTGRSRSCCALGSRQNCCWSLMRGWASTSPARPDQASKCEVVV